MLKSAEAEREYIYKVRKDKQVSNMYRGRIMLRVNCLPLDREYQLAPLVMPSLKKSPQFQPKCIQLWAYEYVLANYHHTQTHTLPVIQMLTQIRNR